MSFVLATLRLALFIAWSVPVVSLQAACLLLRLPARQTIPHLWHRGVVRIAGVRAEVRGEIARAASTLYVSNHVSYLDIVVLGSLLDAHFVSKLEVADWPLFGLLARAGRTVFIERNPRLAAEQQNVLAGIMAEKRSLILFPEGTSSNGNAILPFKSTLFSVGGLLQRQGVAVTVQPVTLAYTRLNGMPLRRVLRPCVAWYGDMAMGSHLWRLFGLGRLTVQVTFHPPVPLERFTSRKDASAYCQQRVAEGLKASYTGRQTVTATAHDH